MCLLLRENCLQVPEVLGAKLLLDMKKKEVIYVITLSITYTSLIMMCFCTFIFYSAFTASATLLLINTSCRIQHKQRTENLSIF